LDLGVQNVSNRIQGDRLIGTKEGYLIGEIDYDRRKAAKESFWEKPKVKVLASISYYPAYYYITV